MYENPPAKAERKPGNPENNAQTTEIINNTITCNGTIQFIVLHTPKTQGKLI